MSIIFSPLDRKTARSQDCKTARPKDCKTARPQDCKTAGLQDRKTAILQDSRRRRPDPQTLRPSDSQTSLSMYGYLKSVAGRKVSLIVLGETHLIRLSLPPALSFVPDALAPPKGCSPTMAPVGLSLM